jgi:signal transduction histidine kinase
VHDVIAHSLSVTMLHVTGARHVLQSDGDVDEATTALRDAERLGRQAMTDIRRTVGLLEQGSPGTAPLPGALDVKDLVGEFGKAGLDVRYHQAGDLTTLSPSTGLTLYRIAQESLANVAKHAPDARTSVILDTEDGPPRLVVQSSSPNGPRPPVPVHNGGSGLKGMSQRAAALGAQFSAGPDPHGGWKVEVVVPRDEEPCLRRSLKAKLLGWHS